MRNTGGGQTAPSTGGASAPSGMPATGNQANVNELSANVRAQAVQPAAQPQVAQPEVKAPTPQPNAQAQAQSERAAGQGQRLESSSPETAPQWKDQNAGTPAQETAKAGQTLHNAGVTQGASQQLSSEQNAKMQSALDNAGKNGQNNPLSRTDQAHEQAKADQTKGAGQETPSHSQGWEK